MPLSPDIIAAIIAKREKRLELVTSGFDYQDADAITRAESLPPYHHLEGITWEDFQKGMHSKWWRMNNLYYIIDKHAEKVLFKCKPPQRKLFNSLHHRVTLPKARQLGFTTFIALMFLDDCLFTPNIEADLIAHRLDDAKSIFRKKIKFPYENLPPELRIHLPLKKESADELIFGNGSSISVTVSSRSGTPNRLHVSEFGKICAKHPEKAREIMTGALPAVPKDGITIFESTAEGNQGYFFDICKEAQDLEKSGKKPNQLQFKFFFAAWWEDPEYSLPPEQYIPIPEQHVKYFDQLETIIGRKLDQGQRCWWYSQYKLLGDDMYRENPSTPEEAFLNRIKGAYFTDEFDRIRREKRICAVPYEKSCLVDTWWDLGMNDVMSIWFTQTVGRELRAIDYFEDSGYGFEYYRDVLEKKGYRYSTHNAPHDIQVRELGTGMSRKKAAAMLGINFNAVPRVRDKQDSIQAARTILSFIWFDEVKCDVGIKRLENYRREWDEKLETYRNNPLHDVNSNGADAFQTLGQGYGKNLKKAAQQSGVGLAPALPPPPAGGWT